MDGSRLLVLGAGSAQAGLLAAARAHRLVVVAADRDPSAPGFRYAHRRALVSLDDEHGLERLARAERIDGVIAPGGNRSVATAARIAAKLGLPHPLGPDAAQTAGSRQRERERYAAAEIAQPAAILCPSLADAVAAAAVLGYPCRLGAVDRQPACAAVESPAALVAAFVAALADSHASACLVEELPSGPAAAVVGFVVGGELRPLVGSGDTRLAAGVVEIVARAVVAVGIELGPVTARVVVGADGPRLLGVAPGLGDEREVELCRRTTGVDLYALALRAALGEPVDARDLEPSRFESADAEALV